MILICVFHENMDAGRRPYLFKNRKIRIIMRLFKVLILLLAAVVPATAQNPDFHIYLCLGQSNMEGNATVEPVDTVDVPGRFKMMAAVDFPDKGRKKGMWYTAVPPLVRHYTGLTPMDYFGRTMVDSLPDNVTVGVVAVAIGGCRIEHLSKDFDPASLKDEPEWLRNFMKEYDNHPYTRLVECAKAACRDGVIKGILLHQGESNSGDPSWPSKVRKLYDDLIGDLGLDPAQVPLLAGELVATEQGGKCGGMNAIIATLPDVIPGAKVVSSEGLGQRGDGLHFTAESYRELGRRYAREALAPRR